MGRLAQAYQRNRLAVIGSAAAVVGTLFAFLQLRKPAAPVVITGGSAGEPALTAADLAAAYGSGAAAAGSGLSAGVSLGQGALGLAGQVAGVAGNVATTLAYSQAAVAGSSASALQQALAAALARFTAPAPGPVATVPPPAPVVTNPPPATTPPPAAPDYITVYPPDPRIPAGYAAAHIYAAKIGDTYESIAMRFYGFTTYPGGDHVAELRRYNGGTNPLVGQNVLVPF